MAPKKKEQQKMSLGDFLTDSGFGGGSWADEVEETYVAGSQPLPPSDRTRYGGGGGGSTSAWQDRGFSVREDTPQRLPDRPPFTAHLGNLSYDADNESVMEFFQGCDVASVRIIEDREMQRPKGFGYVEFSNVEGLKKALTLDGESFQGRVVRIKIADPPRGGDSGRGDSIREMGAWDRRGPLPDIGRPARQGSDFADRRPPRDAAPEGRPAREINWERRGPLSPLPPQEGGDDSRGSSRPRPPPEGMGERNESHRGDRRQSPATWGEGRQEGSRPPRREQPDRPPPPPTAAEKDMQWRDRMRPDAAVKSPAESHEGSEAPSSPAPAAATPAGPPTSRPRLNLQKRTVSEATTDVASPSTGSDAKASPFGAARPINTAAREKEIEAKRLQALAEKKEADEKAKEERRLAKEAAAKAEAEAKANGAESPAGDAEAVETKEESQGQQNGASTEQKIPIHTREPREPREPKEAVSNYKSRAAEAGNWRSASGDQRNSRGPPSGQRGGRGAARGPQGRPPRQNGPAQQQNQAAAAVADAEGAKGEAAAPDEDGWTTVPNKKGRQGRPVAS